jgi:hypothetical protein
MTSKQGTSTKFGNYINQDDPSGEKNNLKITYCIQIPSRISG